MPSYGSATDVNIRVVHGVGDLCRAVESARVREPPWRSPYNRVHGNRRQTALSSMSDVYRNRTEGFSALPHQTHIVGVSPGAVPFYRLELHGFHCLHKDP